MTDVAVIGAGVIGLSVAWRASGRGHRVRVFDGGGPRATEAAAGMLAPSFESAAEHGAGDLARFSLASLALWPQFAAALEKDTGVFVDFRLGVVGVAVSDGGGETLAKSVRNAMMKGGVVGMIGVAEALRLEPALTPRLAAAAYAPDEGEVDPRRVLRALGVALAERGVTIEKRVVARVEEKAGSLWLHFEDGATPVSAGRVIVAAGGLVSRIGGARAAAHVFPVMGEALSLDAPAAPLRRVVRAEGVYLCPKADGRLVVGATSVPYGGSTAVDDRRIRHLRARANETAPALAGLTERERWAGLRPATADGAPILGPDPDGPEGLLYAIGHYRNGVLLAPATAEAVVEALDGGEPAAFRIFGAGRFLHA